MNPIEFPGKIHLINNDQELKTWSQDLSSAHEFGFDTETRPSFKKGEYHKVALLQLATEDVAYLIRLQGLHDFTVLRTIFENAEVLKVGAAIRDDLKELQKIFPFQARQFVELQDLAKAKGQKKLGLKSLTEELLQASLSKAAKITNWEAQKLTEAQILYAATDAWIGLKLYRKLSQAVSTS